MSLPYIYMAWGSLAPMKSESLAPIYYIYTYYVYVCVCESVWSWLCLMFLIATAQNYGTPTSIIGILLQTLPNHTKFIQICMFLKIPLLSQYPPDFSTSISNTWTVTRSQLHWACRTAYPHAVAATLGLLVATVKALA